MATSWYPNALAAQVPWWATFNLECINYTGIFPNILTAPNLAKVLACKNAVLVLLNGADQAKNYASDIVAYQQVWLSAPLGTPTPAPPSLPALPLLALAAFVGIEDFARLIVGQLKADPSMTPAIAAAMGIANPAGSFGAPSIQTIQPQSGSQIHLRCKKANYPALLISSRRGGANWETIGTSIAADFTDARPPLVPGTPEGREYTVQGYLDNVGTGPVSAIKSAVTIP